MNNIEHRFGTSLHLVCCGIKVLTLFRDEEIATIGNRSGSKIIRQRVVHRLIRRSKLFDSHTLRKREFTYITHILAVIAIWLGIQVIERESSKRL